MKREHTVAQSASLKNHIVDMLIRAVERANLSPVVDGATCRFGNHVCEIKVKSSPALPERILEMVKAHLYESYLRERDSVSTSLNTRLKDEAREALLIIRVPRLPIAGRFTHQLESLKSARPTRAAWAIVSDGGGAYLSFPYTDAVAVPDDHAMSQSRLAAGALQSMKDPWASDVTLALLTILLMQRAKPRSTWSKWTPITAEQGVEDMAEKLHVGRSTIYGVIGALTERGWLEAKRGAVPILTDLTGVVNWCFDHRKYARAKRAAVVPLYTPSWKSHADILQWLKAKSDGASITWAITGWRACALHNLSILVDNDTKPVEIVVREPISAVMHDWKLRKQPSLSGASLLISQSGTPITTFSCVGQKIDDLPVIDPWQAALDVIGDPQRGIEQATAIADFLWLEKA